MRKFSVENTRNRIRRTIFLLTIPISFIILSIIIFDMNKIVKHLAVEYIDVTIAKYDLRLKDYFEPVFTSLKIIRDMSEGGIYNNLCPENLNPKFIPIIENINQITNISVASSDGTEYILYKKDSLWNNRYTTNTNGVIEVKHQIWSYTNSLIGTKIEEWVDVNDTTNNPVDKKWFQEIICTEGDTYTWSEPYKFKLHNKPGLSISAKWEDKHNNTTKVLSFDVLLSIVSKFTTNLTVNKTGKTFIFYEDYSIIGLPSEKQFLHNDSINKYVLAKYNEINSPLVETVFAAWADNNNEYDKAFSFILNNEKWWCEIKKIHINKHSLFIVVAVPESDFLDELNNTIYIIISSFLFLTLLTIIIIRGNNRQQRANKLLNIQKKEIEDQKQIVEEINHEVSQSIDYATRIQQAILPEISVLKENLSDHFVLLKPKDKVSGDFYWWAKVDNYLVITAADSTGHGVPGAFMSMLGSEFLKVTVLKDKIVYPSKILNSLREGVIKALKQTGNIGTQKDGMDMSLVSINLETNIVSYAGANNPLYIIRNKELISNNKAVKLFENTKSNNNNSKLLYEVKADKMPIAIYDKMDEFKTHEFKLDKGDILYMFSDGFADQFGGPKEKKYKYKPFKKLLLEISSKPMSEQLSILNETFEKWKGNLDQIDDVIIIGVKL